MVVRLEEPSAERPGDNLGMSEHTGPQGPAQPGRPDLQPPAGPTTPGGGPTASSTGPGYPGPAPYGAPVSGPVRVGDALSWAWEKLWANPLVLLVGFGIWSLLSASGPTASFTTDDGSAGLQLAASIVTAVVSLFSAVALANVCLITASGRRADWNDFVTFPNLAAGLLAGILTSILTAIGFVLLVIPGVILLYLWYFTIYVTVDEGVDAVEAMRRSWRLLADNVGTFVPFALVGVLLSVLGVVTVFGWVVTTPLVALMSVYGYVRVRGYDVAR